MYLHDKKNVNSLFLTQTKSYKMKTFYKKHFFFFIFCNTNATTLPLFEDI